MDKLKSNILMVMVPDRLSELLTKGEIVDRYYNPGEVFDEVHIVMFNDDKPDPALVQRTVGSARLVLHNVARRQGALPQVTVLAPVFASVLGPPSSRTGKADRAPR